MDGVAGDEISKSSRQVGNTPRLWQETHYHDYATVSILIRYGNHG